MSPSHLPYIEISAAADRAAKAKARELWSQGFMRKFIARETGLSERTVSRVCADLPKPYEHRGRKRRAFNLDWDD